MKKIITYIVIILGFILPVLFTSSCKKHLGPTSIMVQDSIRHYYTILQGQPLVLSFRVANVGKNPLVLTDIHPSCGCISMESENNNVVLPDKELTLKFNFDSGKNTGFVEHKIYLYGNIEPDGMAILTFDVHVVPVYGSAPDYEEWYYENKEKDNVEELINGNEAQRGYWINNGDYPEDYSASYKKYPWREKSTIK